MFRFYDKTRRKLAVAAFVLLGLLPTCAVAGWCLWRTMPWETRLAAESLERQIGWKVKLERLSHPRPNVEVYENLTLLDPETGRPIFSCNAVKITRRKNAESPGQETSPLTFSFVQPEIDAAAFPQIRQLVERILQSQSGPGMDCHITAAEVILLNGKHFDKLASFDSVLKYFTDGVQLKMNFRIDGLDMKETMAINVARKKSSPLPSYEFVINTGKSRIPCEFLDLGLPQFATFNGDCFFQGVIWANQLAEMQQNGSQDSWSGSISGTFTGVNLEAVFSRLYPQALNGYAEVSIKSALFARNRLESLKAMVSAGPGKASKAFVQSCIEKLELTPQFDVEIADDAIDYQHLIFDVALDSSGFRINGYCPFKKTVMVVPGYIMTNGGQRLLDNPPPNRQPLPMALLIQALTPSNKSQVPATELAEKLLRYLPLSK